MTTAPEELGTDVNAQAQVRVTLTSAGSVEAVSFYHSAGNVLLDREALRAARQSSYRAEVRDCVPVRGDYLFTVDFTGNNHVCRSGTSGGARSLGICV